MNLPHALATLTRDVLAHWHPRMAAVAYIWEREEHWDGVERLRLKPCPYEPGHGTLYGVDRPERLRGPRGPDPFSVVLTREELQQLYPDPARCVGEDGSVVYAPLHFEHPPLLVKGRLKE